MINNIKIDTHLVVIFPVETDRDYIEKSATHSRDFSHELVATYVK